VYFRVTIGKDSEKLGFQLRKRSRGVGTVTITDLDFADDIALITSQIDHIQDFLQSWMASEC